MSSNAIAHPPACGTTAPGSSKLFAYALALYSDRL